MASHPDVDMVSFTGSTRAGVLVAQAAAPTIKRVVQELGGKSPNVFLPDADFATAVPKGVLGMMRNCGQSCASPTRMVVPAARLAEVEALATEAAEAIVVGDPLDEGSFLGPLANATVYGLSSHVQSADQEVARRVARQIRAGQVHINYPAWSGYAPFGGYKQSGNGREYGRFALEEYLETKAVLGW